MIDCDCDDRTDEDGLYQRTCEFCGNKWLALHCPHESIQNPCSECKKRPIPVTISE